MELFERSEPSARTPTGAPLAVRMAPRTLDELVGQDHLFAPGTVFRTLIDRDAFVSAILFGPPGTGKTAAARIIAARTGARVVRANATLVGVPELREIIRDARSDGRSGRRVLVLLDEIHHFNRTQQDVLLPEVEQGTIILVGMTTENPYYYVNQALLSRSVVMEFHALPEEAVRRVVQTALEDAERGLGAHGLRLAPDALDYLVHYADGDARRALNALELAATYLLGSGERRDISIEVLHSCVPAVAVRYDKSSDAHYDHISAFIKSVRGGDPDAVLYWMVKMLEGGEDPRFIVRRLIILASEDIGNADPFGLVLATAALQAVEFVGMPEAKLILSQTVTYLACAEKSNAATEALAAASEELRRGPVREVPAHLKDPSRDGAALGHGKGYRYPHSFPGGFVAQEYLPAPVVFYKPKNAGAEREIRRRLEQWRSIAAETKNRR